MSLKYTELLLKNKLFLEIQQKITRYEEGRTYCHHELSHALDVCRVAWIMYMEEKMFSGGGSDVIRNEAARDSREEWLVLKDRFYVTGLLHDIGRAAQYETGEHHSAAGIAPAQVILKEIQYPDAWIQETIQIIGEHHGRGIKPENKRSISYYIEKADHISRNCFCCKAAETCKWNESDRNQTILS